jgi:hypothetical protein
MTARIDWSAAEERAAIVAFLRDLPGYHDPFEGASLRMAAEAIEAGVHLVDRTPPVARRVGGAR